MFISQNAVWFSHTFSDLSFTVKSIEVSAFMGGGDSPGENNFHYKVNSKMDPFFSFCRTPLMIMQTYITHL